jgi:hypothetical protein
MTARDLIDRPTGADTTGALRWIMAVAALSLLVAAALHAGLGESAVRAPTLG